MNNIASLAEVLEKLGFDASLHTSLTTYISLQLPNFSIQQKAVKEGDVLKFHLFFQRKDHAYSCLYYDAILRKNIILPSLVIDGIDLSKLDNEMKSIQWEDIFTHPHEIEPIIISLQKLSASKEGKEFSEQLKVKYWCDTPLESLMNIATLRTKYEIAQRFYFMENGNGISIDEAYRFLNNKWMEKQLKKKSPASRIEPAPPPKKVTKNTRKHKEH